MKSENAAVPSGNRCRANKAKIVSRDDGRNHFNHDTPRVARVASIIVTGTHADMALEAAREIYPTTEPADVEAALVKASGHFNKPRSSETQPDLDTILRWAADAAARNAAANRHGAPETHAGGPPGEWAKNKYDHPWCFLSQVFLDGLSKKYLAATEDYKTRHDFWFEYNRVVQAADKREYGSRLQGIVETAFDQHVAAVHAKRGAGQEAAGVGGRG
jgi:hypothetical protein